MSLGVDLGSLGVSPGDVFTVVKMPVVKILAAYDDGTAKIWNSETGSLMKTLTGHDSMVCSPPGNQQIPRYSSKSQSRSFLAIQGS